MPVILRRGAERTAPGVPVSSVSTLVLKFVWPAGWLGGMGYLNVLAFTGSPGLRWGGGQTDPAWGRPLLIGLFALGMYVALRVSAPLKRVHLVPGGLCVSNYFREIRVPWTDVARGVVHGGFGGRRSPVVELELRRRSAFGSRISLLPASPQALAMLQENAAAEAAIRWERR
ncbi:MAG TPA: hypothetical protein VF006_33905 [Longimicrobium sp.]